MADQGIIPNEAGSFMGPTLPLPRAGTAADALGAWKEPGTVEGPGFEMYPPSVAPGSRWPGLQEQVAAAPPLERPRPPVWVGRGRELDIADTREKGPVPVQDLGALQAETAQGMGPAELPMRPGPEPVEIPGGFRGRVRSDEELAAILAAEGERARRGAREQVVQEPAAEGAAQLPELGPAMEERLAGLDIAPEQFPAEPGQMVIGGMMDPQPLTREPAPRAPRRTGKQLGLDLGEGVEVKRPLTARERADAKTAALDEQVRRALADEDAQGLIETQKQKELVNVLDEMSRVKSRQREFTAARKALKEGDTTNPIFAEAEDRALAKVMGDFRRMAKGGLDPAEQLRAAREKRLADAEAARVDAEERAAIADEGAGVEPAPVPEAPVAAEPAPTMAAPIPERPLVAPEPARPTPEAPVPAEPVLAAPAEPAPAAPISNAPSGERIPTDPVEARARAPEHAVKLTGTKPILKTPEEQAYVAGHPELQSRIETRLREAASSIGRPLNGKETWDAIHGVVRSLIKEKRTADRVAAGETVPAKPAVPAKVEAPAAGVTRLPPGVAEGAEGGVTAQPRQRPGTRVKEGPIPGGEGPVAPTEAVVGENPRGKKAFKTEVRAEARAEGGGLREHAHRWLTVLHPHLQKQGLNIEDVLKPFVDREVKLPGNPPVKFTGAKAAEFARYMQAYERQLAGEAKGVPAAARELALKELAPDEAVRKGLRNRIGAVEKLLSTEVMEATRQVVAKEKGVPVPEAPVVKGKDRSPAKLKELVELKTGLDRRLGEWIGKAPEARSNDEIAALLGQYRDMAEQIPSSLGRSDTARKLSTNDLINFGMQVAPEKFANALKNKQGFLDYGGEGTTAKFKAGLITKLADALGVKLPPRRVEQAPVATTKVERTVAPKGWAVVQRREGNVVRHRSPEGLTATLGRTQDGRFTVDFEGAGKHTEAAVTKTLDDLLVDPNVAEIHNAAAIKPDGMKPSEWSGKLEAWRQKQEKAGLLAPEVMTDNPDAPIVWRKVLGSTKGMEAVDELSRADRNRVNSLPREQLSVRAEREMARAFDLAESEGVDLGDGLRAVNHHDHFGWGYVTRVASIGRGAAVGMKQIFDKLVAAVGPKTKLEFGGLTMSPHLSGLYREAAGGKSAKVYGNLAEAVYRSHSYEDAVSRVTHMLGHEVAHLSEDVGEAGARIEHGYHFDDLAGYVDRLVKTEEWQRDAVDTLKKAGFTEEVYAKLKGDLADQFREARDEVRGQDWRQGAAAVEGVPVGAAEGGAAAQPSLLGRGAETAAGDRAHGLQRGGDVHGGGGRSAGGVRPGAAALEGRPEGVRGGEAQGAGPVAGRGRGEAPAFFAGLESRDLPESVEAARKNIRTLNELIKTKAVPITKAMRDASEYATHLTDERSPGRLSDAEIADVIKAAPDPRGRPGVRAGGLNMLVEFPNMPDRAKARMILFQDFMDEAGETARSHVQHWDEVEQDVRDMLGVKSADQYLEMMRHRGGGVTAFDVMALRTVRDEFVRRTNRLDEMWRTKADAGDEAGARAALDEWQVARNNEAAAIFVSSEKLTGAARALAIARARGLEMDPQAMAKAVIRASILERLRKRFPDAAELNRKTDEMVAKFYDAKGNQDYGAFLKAMRVALGRTGWRAGFDKVLEFFKAGLLGWPSEVANITSNNLFRGSRFLEDTIAAGLDAGYSKLSGKPREVFLGEAAVAMRAARRSLMEGMPELMKTEMNLLKLQGGDLAKVMESGAAIDDLMMTSGAIGGKLGNFLRFHFDSMQDVGHPGEAHVPDRHAVSGRSTEDCRRVRSGSRSG